MARGSSSSLLSLIRRFRELKGARSLGPVPRAVLDEFLEPNLAVGNANNHAKILAEVIADLDLVDVLFRGSHQRKRRLAPVQRSHYLQRFERIRLQRLFAPGEIGRQIAPPLEGLDLSRLERVRQIEGVIGKRLTGLYLGQWVELALDSLALLLHPGAQVLMALAPAAGEEQTNAKVAGKSRAHLFLAFASIAALRCLATSSSSR